MSNKSSYEKYMDEQVSAHIHAGLYESKDPHLRYHAARQGIYIPEPNEQEQSSIAPGEPDPIADRIHNFWDKWDKYLYPLCIVLGALIGYAQFDPGQPADNEWQLPLLGAIAGAATPILLRSVCILAYVVLKLALYLGALALLGWVIAKVMGYA